MRIAILPRGRKLNSTIRVTEPAHAAGARVRAVPFGWAFALGAVLFAHAGLAEVELTGLDDAQSANVLAYLDFDEEPCDAPAWRVEQQYQAAPARIRDALQALGYYEPRIVPKLERDDACWHATFAVQLGEPVAVRRLDVTLDGEAAGDAAFVAARDQSPLRAGGALHHGDYETLKRRWSDLALERGYADAKFTESRIDVYPEQRVADIVLHFDSGKRYRFGDVTFEQDVLSDRLVRSYLPFRARGFVRRARAHEPLRRARGQRLLPQHRGAAGARRTATRARSRSRSCSRAPRAG